MPDTAVRTRKEQADLSRRVLLDAARRCFADKGYEGTTVAAILDEAGMARGALYHYFPGGKRDIFDAVFAQINDEYHERRDAMAGLASPLDRVRGGIRAFFELCTEDDFARIALIDAPQIVPGQAERGSSYALLRDQLADAMAQGEVRSLPVEATAMALYGAVRSAGEFVASSGDRDQAAETASDILDSLLEGLRVIS